MESIPTTYSCMISGAHENALFGFINYFFVNQVTDNQSISIFSCILSVLFIGEVVCSFLSSYTVSPSDGSGAFFQCGVLGVESGVAGTGSNGFNSKI